MKIGKMWTPKRDGQEQFVPETLAEAVKMDETGQTTLLDALMDYALRIHKHIKDDITDLAEWVKQPNKPAYSASEITDFPDSMPASDVYAWAKQPNKPSYSWGEIGSKPATFPPAAHDINDHSNWWQRMYPVGCIYMSIVSTSPATLFGGTWAAIPSGRVIRTGSGGTEGGSDTNSGITVTGYAEASTSGSNLVYRYQNTPAWTSQWVVPLGSSGNSGGGSIGTGFSIKGTGSGGSNVPLSYHVYAWRRTA